MYRVAFWLILLYLSDRILGNFNRLKLKRFPYPSKDLNYLRVKIILRIRMRNDKSHRKIFHFRNRIMVH